VRLYAGMKLHVLRETGLSGIDVSAHVTDVGGQLVAWLSAQLLFSGLILWAVLTDWSYLPARSLAT